ncbi:MAG TPA: hypothetical protein ENI11_00805 [Actinobacteria bacterium]|nr:hypothetical protein [Actinomycetota bacterium]
MSRGEKIVKWLPSLVWMAVIFYLSSRSSLPGPWWKSIVGHFTEYAILSVLFWLALTQTTELNGKSVVVVAILLASAYSVSDEWHQSMVPQRTPELYDLLLDFFGAALAALLASRLLSGSVGRGQNPGRN